MLDIVFFLAAIAGVALIWGLVFLMIRSRLRQAASAKAVHDGARVTIPLISGFAALRGLPFLASARNSISPRLILHADHVEVKVLRTGNHPYNTVERVDYRRGLGTRNVVLTFSGHAFTFWGNTGNEALAGEAIGLLAARGCPLTPRAQALLAKG